MMSGSSGWTANPVIRPLVMAGPSSRQRSASMSPTRTGSAAAWAAPGHAPTDAPMATKPTRIAAVVPRLRVAAFTKPPP